ncbi:hypothetical protein LCGC14_1364050, partial [marine sediment metagenome]
MPHTFVRSLFDVLREQQSEERDAAEVRAQARLFRQTARGGTFSDVLNAALAGKLFPLGRDYERERLEDGGIRPPSFAEVLRNPPPAAPVDISSAFPSQPLGLGNIGVSAQQGEPEILGPPQREFSPEDFAQLVTQQEQVIRAQQPGLPDAQARQMAFAQAEATLSAKAKADLQASGERTMEAIEELRRTSVTPQNVLGNLRRAGDALIDL